MANEPTVTIAHVRAQMPRRRGSYWYRDTNDYSKFAQTLCGAPMTDKDMAIRDAPKAERTGWPVCRACLDVMKKWQAA